MNNSGVVLISEGLYRLLLGLYPRRFREEWGLHMSRTFRDSSREQYERDGLLGLIGLWLPTLADLLKTAVEERAQQGEISMSKETMIQIGGPAMMVAGVLWMIAGAGQLQTQYWDRFGGFDIGYEIAGGLLFVAFIPLLIALLALNAYAGPNRTLRVSSWLASAACVVAIPVGIFYGIAGDQTDSTDNLPLSIFLLSFLALIVAFIVYGIGALRAKPLPRWNAAPLIAGVVSAIALVLFTVGWDAMDEAFGAAGRIILSIVVGMSWALLGYAMLSLRTQADAPRGA